MAATPEQIRQIEQALQSIGINPGTVDGVQDQQFNQAVSRALTQLNAVIGSGGQITTITPDVISAFERSVNAFKNDPNPESIYNQLTALREDVGGFVGSVVGGIGGLSEADKMRGALEIKAETDADFAAKLQTIPENILNNLPAVLDIVQNSDQLFTNLQAAYPEVTSELTEDSEEPPQDDDPQAEEDELSHDEPPPNQEETDESLTADEIFAAADDEGLSVIPMDFPQEGGNLGSQTNDSPQKIAMSAAAVERGLIEIASFVNGQKPGTIIVPGVDGTLEQSVQSFTWFIRQQAGIETDEPWALKGPEDIRALNNALPGLIAGLPPETQRQINARLDENTRDGFFNSLLILQRNGILEDEKLVDAPTLLSPIQSKIMGWVLGFILEAFPQAQGLINEAMVEFFGMSIEDFYGQLDQGDENKPENDGQEGDSPEQGQAGDAPQGEQEQQTVLTREEILANAYKEAFADGTRDAAESVDIIMRAVRGINTIIPLGNDEQIDAYEEAVKTSLEAANETLGEPGENGQYDPAKLDEAGALFASDFMQRVEEIKNELGEPTADNYERAVNYDPRLRDFQPDADRPAYNINNVIRAYNHINDQVPLDRHQPLIFRTQDGLVHIFGIDKESNLFTNHTVSAEDIEEIEERIRKAKIDDIEQGTSSEEIDEIYAERQQLYDQLGSEFPAYAFFAQNLGESAPRSDMFLDQIKGAETFYTTLLDAGVRFLPRINEIDPQDVLARAQLHEGIEQLGHGPSVWTDDSGRTFVAHHDVLVTEEIAGKEEEIRATSSNVDRRVSELSIAIRTERERLDVVKEDNPDDQTAHDPIQERIDELQAEIDDLRDQQTPRVLELREEIVELRSRQILTRDITDDLAAFNEYRGLDEQVKADTDIKALAPDIKAVVDNYYSLFRGNVERFVGQMPGMQQTLIKEPVGLFVNETHQQGQLSEVFEKTRDDGEVSVDEELSKTDEARGNFRMNGGDVGGETGGRYDPNMSDRRPTELEMQQSGN